jgi:hypothetical protein
MPIPHSRRDAAAITAKTHLALKCRFCSYGIASLQDYSFTLWGKAC